MEKRILKRLRRRLARSKRRYEIKLYYLVAFAFTRPSLMFHFIIKLEEKVKKDQVEDERLKLIELQKKTPEVTITVVNSQKQALQKPVPQQKLLPEVSILPAKLTPQLAVTTSKQANATKKKNNEVIGNPTKNANKTRVTTASTTAENAKKKTASEEKIGQVTKVEKAKGKTNEQSLGNATTSSPPVDLSNLTKKERKKLRREMEKQDAIKKELAGKQSANSEQLQIVTIKRIMESINSEPTVTITLKGQTPAEDRVLFTLVNGQTKDSPGDTKSQQSTGKKKKNKGNGSANQQQTQTVNKCQQVSKNTSSAKFETVQQKSNPKSANQQQTIKSKSGKQQEDKFRQQQTPNAPETKVIGAKDKKDKRKINNENKENIKQPVNDSSQKQESNSANKKSSKVNSHFLFATSVFRNIR